MKRLLLAVLLTSFCLNLSVAQENTTDSIPAKKHDGKNLIKLNLTALPLNTFSVSYERAIGKKIAVGIGYRHMPKGDLPFLNQITKSMEEDDAKHIKNVELGNYAITPEVKFYFGKSVFRGFYIAPFGRYAVYSANLPFEFTYEESGVEKKETINLSEDIKTITGGILFGAQWKLSRLLYLDWFILGPNVGSAKGDITGSKNLPLTADQRQGLDEALEDFNDSDIPFVKIDGKSTDNGAKINLSGPWAGLRAGISLGIRF